MALDLRGSDLRGSLIGLICVALDLHRSFACGSDLRGSDWRGSDWRGSDLREADLRVALTCVWL